MALVIFFFKDTNVSYHSYKLSLLFGYEYQLSHFKGLFCLIFCLNKKKDLLIELYNWGDRIDQNKVNKLPIPNMELKIALWRQG